MKAPSDVRAINRMSANRMSASTKKIAAVAILSGGDSRRMGQDKAALTYGGYSILERQVNNIRMALPDIPVLICSNNRRYATLDQYPVHYSEDTVASSGPLGALAGALKHARSTRNQSAYVFAMPTDTLVLPTQILAQLLSADSVKNDKSAEAGAVLLRSQRLHPLHGLFSLLVADDMEQYVKSGGRAVMGFLETIGFTEATVPEEWEPVLNFNSPEDFASACAVFDGIESLS